MSDRKKYIKSKINKLKPKKSILKRPWFWFIILFLAFILFVLYFLVFYPGVQVKNIIISGNQRVSTGDINNLILNDINREILSIGSLKITSKSIFWADSTKLTRDILAKFSEVKSVKIDKKFMQTMDFEITERDPVAIFCPSLDKKMETENGRCYLIDDKGIVFEPVKTVPQNMIFILQPVNNPKILTGDKVVQQNVMDLILKVKKNLESNFKINLNEASVASDLKLDMATAGGWHIYFDTSAGSDIKSQITELNLFLQGKIPPDDIKNLRYIDLRPKDRAIVCDNSICGG